MAATRYTKEILLADERNRNVSAVVRYGPHLFLSSSDGHRDIVTEQVDMDLDDKRRGRTGERQQKPWRDNSRPRRQQKPGCP